ncbi:MAG: hypothetical protein GEV13_14560 [Rhodospirillales bacterium]|nr:hypothetical protein [Rhodospirillales bacterium]
MAFNPSVDLTKELYELFELGPGMWHPLVEKALKQPEGKYRDLDWLASVVFYLNHPERRNPADGYYRPIDPSTQPASVAEYYEWRKKVASLISFVKVDPIKAFRPLVTQPLVLIDNPFLPGHHMFQAAFQIHLKLNPDLANPGLYEYRQLISGGLRFQPGPTGAWQSYPPTHWQIPPSSPSSLAFGATALPIGLYEGAWKEDGIVGPPDRFYGHRDKRAFPSSGGERDEYRLRQRDGHEYFLGDRPSISANPFKGGTFVVAEGMRIKYNLWFRGLVVRFDKPPSSSNRKILEVVKTINWGLQFDKTVTQVTPVQYT